MLIAFVLFADMPLRSDAAGYSKQAIAIAADFPGTEAYYWPPAMPYILAVAYHLFGDNLAVARIVNILLCVLMVYAAILLTTVATAVFMLLPISCVGWVWALGSRQRWQQIAQRRWFWGSVALFALVQLEYGYWAIVME